MQLTDEDMVVISRKTLEMLPVGATVRESIEMRQWVETNEDGGDILVRKIAAYVLAEKVADEVYSGSATSLWPATTWQMFKHTHRNSWWLGWFVDRRPVKMHKDTHTMHVGVTRYETYPKSDLVTSSTLGPSVRYDKVQTNYGTYRDR